MLSNLHADVLRVIVSAAEQDPSIIWALTGSTSFALQGMPLEAHDIDVQTNEKSAYKLGNQLKKYIVEPIRFCGTEKIRSHFGRLKICDIDIEIMGDPIIQHVYFKKMSVPVLCLAYEAEAYRRLGRAERANDIERFIAGQRT